ncbi:MAG TPA: hypothetical protein VI215_03385 [Bacteroidota bacterium]|jgi:hypothetical protein
MNPKTTTIEEFYNLIDEHPELTVEGFGVQSHPWNYETRRSQLYNQFEPFQASMDFLSNEKNYAHLEDDMRGSFRLAHVIGEYWFNLNERNLFISEGAVIAALIHLGLPYKRVDNSPGIVLDVQNQIKELMEYDSNRK